MLFDQLDKKLKDAADNHHPTYDEKAWLKMEKLLDKHMPVDKDRRRILFLILFAIIGLGGAGVLIMKPWKEKTHAAVQPKTEQPKPVMKGAVQEPVKTTIGQTTSEPLPEKPLTGKVPFIQTVNKKPELRNSYSAKPENKVPVKVINKNNPAVETGSSPSQDPGEKHEKRTIFPGTPQANEDVFSLKKEMPANPANPANLVDPVPNTIVKESAPAKSRTKKQHAVFLSVTAGPDWVFVEDNGGSVKPFYGAGIGYTFNNRISFRMGFYTGRKVYSATPGYYNPPPNFYIYYPYLEKVDANCKIFEIPLSLSYHFGKPGKPAFFASAGVSSFIMKEETYKYYYKTTPTGPTLNRSYTLKDVNKHKFAELTISGGYTRGLTRHISLTAEPYLKLPLKGVGYGKVKLSSAGLAMSVNINPFAKKPN